MVKKVLGEEEEGETLGEAAAEETAVDAAELRLNRLAPEAIIDLRLSNSRPADEEIMRRGFTQLLPDTRTAGYAVATSSGSFGRGQSLWLWRQRQGSMRGRLKPIIDIQLNSLGVSSGLVLAGYTCLSAQVSGQWVWIKRAENDEQAADAIVDLVVTIGHQKDASDKIWTSPGVGWSRVDGNFGKGMMSSYDAFLWFRPLRARTSEAAKSSPLRTMVGLKDEMRLGVLLGVTKKCLRHAVPVERMSIEIPSELLPPKAIGEKSPLPAAGSSAASFDFSIHFHKFDKSNAGKLDVSKFEHMLFDVGLRMERRDVYLLFHLFNIAQDKVISRQEFWTILMLTELELDKTLDRLCASLRIVAGSDEEGKAILGVTKLRINHNFRRIFRFINLNHDGILSILDILKLCAELGVYVTEEEGRQLMRLIDRDRDDRIEEGDFLKCLNRNSDIVFNRAQRIREASSALRVWMVRNSGTSLSSTQHAAEKTKLWGELKVMHERSYGTAFVGFLTSDDLLLLFFKMGLRLTPGEAQELALIMAPGRNGNLQLPDLISFMASSCRSFGELCALMQRDIMKPLLDCYASYRGQLLSGQEHLDMKDEFDDSIRVIIKAVEAARTGEGTSDVVSVTQLKTGIETVMRGYVTPEELMPNLEEWASLCSLAGAVVVGEESVGVRVKAFLEGLCAHIAGPLTCGRKGESVDLLQVSVELQRVLQKEAELAGRGRKREYKPVFAMFDLDGSGDISLSEFNSMLSRLQLIDDLTEAQVPLLLAMFDRKKKNSISFDDFVHFGEMGLRGPRKNDEEDSDEEDRKIGLLSVNPPAAVTRDVSCDWLVWFLWKECTRKNAKEPENMVTELEVSCAESVLGGSAGYVEAGELWRLLLEVGLRGHLTRPQFDAGIKQLLDQGKSGDDEEETLVDYEALCRYIIRMGRAFNEQEQKNLEIDERRYQDMKKAFVRAMLDEAPNLDNTHSGTDKRANNSLRFERVFKRMDSNKDGKLTLEEFKTGLKELRYRGAKAWTQQMIWRLFEDIDSDNDGLLSLIELSAFIRSNGRESKSAIKLQRAKAERGDEDDEGFFAQTGFHITDEQLFAKVSGVLQEVVAPAAASERGKHSHSEMIKSTVRKFFQRSDEGARGLVSEARFKVFCRQTGLANKLSAQEMKMLMMRLSRRVGADLLVDYERLCSRISVVEISAPLVKGEGVLLQLQDAAIEAESAGRPFIGISDQELLHTAKMMGCILTPADITALRDLVPHVFSISVGGEQSVDYRELARLLETYTPKFTTGFGGSFVRTAATTLMRTPSSYNRSESNATLDFHGMSSRPTTPFSPFNGSPFSTTRLQPQTNTTLSAPGGQFISTSNLNRSVDFGGTSKGVAAFEMVLCAIAERVSTAAQNRSAVRGVPYSILKQLAAFDRNGSGFVTVRVLQSTLRDLGVALSPTDLLALNSAFGAADGGIDYSAFSQLCDREGSSAGESAFSSTKKSHNLFGEMPKTSLSFLQKPRIMQRLLELQREGDLRSVFSASDIDGSGLVSAMKFAQIVRDLALLQSEYQVGQCVSAFASLSDRQSSMVCYEDFCDELDRMAADFAASHEGLIPPPHTNRTLRESLATITDFNSAIGRVSQKNSEPADIEEDDDGDEDDQEFGPPRSPSPKPRQERRYDRRYSSSPSCHSRSIPDNSAASFSPARRSNIGRIEAPRSPPRKVGASLWGSRTALHKKGIPHRQDDGETWVCAVCYYTENDAAARTCEVCTSPNHMNKDFQVKVQCSNCTFLNGQFALSCEMCGEGILKKRK